MGIFSPIPHQSFQVERPLVSSLCDEDDAYTYMNFLYAVFWNIIQILVPHVDKAENGHWSSFFEDRDVHPNETAIGQISEAIYNSRKIILVLSPAYLADSRREYEVKLL